MSSENVKLYKRSEIAEHNSKENNWFVIHNNVYDVTAFLNEVSFQAAATVDNVVVVVITAAAAYKY